MATFSERLRAEIEYKGLLQKEVAFRADIKKRALDMYLGAQNSMPPADVAVKLAKVLGVSVEYLVTGEEKAVEKSSLKNRGLEEDLGILPDDVRFYFVSIIHSLAEHERFRRSGAEP